jgi:hypothetical protein
VKTDGQGRGGGLHAKRLQGRLPTGCIRRYLALVKERVAEVDVVVVDVVPRGVPLGIARSIHGPHISLVGVSE